jgi:nucleoside-diphosphate-sugar epimerase
MKVLVTGIKGFTGRYVAAALATAGHEVYGLGLQRPAAGERNYYQADLGDVGVLTRCLMQVRPEAIIHLAALAYVDEADGEAFYRINLLGTRNLLVAAARAESADCVLLVSSGNIYGNQPGGPLSEACLPKPANEYAVSKLAMEYMASTWQDRLPIVVARPFNYTGIGQSERFLVPKIVSHFRRRAATIELGNVDVQRDFCDVRTVADAYRAIAERKPVGATLNVCSGRLTGLRDIVALCEKISGHAIQVEVNPCFSRSNEVRVLCGDPSRLRAELGGWEPRPVEETLQWMLGGDWHTVEGAS